MHDVHLLRQALQLLMRRPECHSFVAISPLANMYDFNFLAPCPTPGLVVHGDVDEVTPKESVIRLTHQLSMQKRGHKIALHLIPGADHIFSNQLKSMEKTVQDYVFSKLAPLMAPVDILGGHLSPNALAV